MIPTRAFGTMATFAVLAMQATSATQGRMVASASGLVVCASAPACDVGADILAQGGTAVDAAVATAFAMAVTHPSAGNIGGGGFMLIRPPAGDPIVIDYRETAPLAVTATMYVDATGQIDRILTKAGYLAAGVPGTVRGLALAHQKFGKLPWKDVVSPAVRLASDGFALSETLAGRLNGELQGAMGGFPASVAAYGKPGGAPWAAGDRIVLPDLGRTLEAIANDGPDAFYTGWIADAIEADMKANGGLITKADLAAYEAKVRAPVRGTFRAHEIISVPPPSSGGVAVIEMLNILENFNLKGAGRFSAATLHLMIEAARRAYLDRARHLGDPDFADVPVARLTSQAHAKELAATIDRNKATSSVELGKDIVSTGSDTESGETTHFSVVDRTGMAVANTYTLEDTFGSRVVVKGAGFLLNNEMGDFNKKPGETNRTGDIGTPANLIAPRKRMLSSMTPTMVVRGGRLVLVTGSPGGRTIPNTVLDVVLDVIDFDMDAREAVDAGRMHHQWLPDETRFEEGTVAEDVLATLRAMGHTVRSEGRQGDAHTIWVNPRSGVAYGANDLRSADSKASKVSVLP